MSYRQAKKLLSKTDISAQYKSIWLSKRGGSKNSALLRRKYIDEDVKRSYIDKQVFTEREKLFILVSLYWGEGAKRDLSFANSDPRMVRIFVNLLTDVFVLPKERITASIRIFEDMDSEKCKRYWGDLLFIPISAIYVLKGKKQGKLSYGMCRIRLQRGTNILNTIKAHIGSISEIYATIAQLDRAKDS